MPAPGAAEPGGGGGAGGATAGGSSWTEKRVSCPEGFRNDDIFTDIKLKVQDKTFKAHRVILSSHCEYFLNLFQSGMREAEEGCITFHDIDAVVFEHILNYIYTGIVPKKLKFEVLRDLLLAANMWQITDLENAILQMLVRICSPSRCLKIYLFVKNSAGIFQDQTVKQSVEHVLVETIRDRWPMIVGMSATPGGGGAAFRSPSRGGKKDIPKDGGNSEDDDDFGAVLSDLDLESFKEILSIKSEQEEVGDFSFSFNQSDICLAVVQWIDQDISSRFRSYNGLREFFCLHQINGNATNALILLSQEIALHDKDFKMTTNMDACQGYWCPHRKISGLLIAHAWSPHISNRITCDHIFFYFTIPKMMASEATKPLHRDFFYDVGQFGDLGDGEKHCLIPNNCVYMAPIKSYMLLTVDGGTLSGTVIDPVDSKYQCKYHHNQIYRFCPSTISECGCEFEQISVCNNPDPASGRVHIVTCPVCQKSDSNYNPCCETFVAVKPPPKPSTRLVGVYSRVSVIRDGNRIFSLGGHVLDPGDLFSYIHCSYDLQEFQATGNVANNYKSGHSHVKTKIGYLKDTPIPNLQCQKYDISSETWSDCPEMKLPFQLGDSATVIFQDRLWVIGGYEVKYDDDLKLFYQNPVSAVWIYDFKTEVWEPGPPLPSDSDGRHGFTRGTAYNYDGKLYFSGGARLKINKENESNQIYEYVTNTKVFRLNPGNQSGEAYSWSLLLDLGRFSSKFRDEFYSILAVVPTDVALTRLKVRKDQLGSKFTVKYLNINFPLAGEGGGSATGGQSSMGALRHYSPGLHWAKS